MSSRALRKFQTSSNKLSFESHDENSDDNVDVKNMNNPFDMLEIEDSVNLSDNESSQIDIEEEKKKTIRKKKKRKNVTAASKQNENDDEIDVYLKEVNEILGEIPLSSQLNDVTPSVFSKKNSLLSILPKNLNPANEMKKKFGSKVVQSDRSHSRKSHRSHQRKTYTLVQPKSTWPAIHKIGLSMELIDSDNDRQYFKINHDWQYQKIQNKFYDAVDSMDPRAIMDVLQSNSYHIDTLLQMSEICKVGEDTQTAADLIERALYCFEFNFHSSFNLMKGNCRLDFRYPENRSFYLAIYRHLMFIGQRGCYGTALEFTKLLLSLDPENDPFGALLMIDFYALRSHQGEYLHNFYNEWEAERNLSQLPNFAFSIPLALFHESRGKEVNLEAINLMLQDALLKFPGFLMPLLDKCSIQPDNDVAKSEFFNGNVQYSQPVGLAQLLSLYIARCHQSWKDTDVISWLEQNVKEIIAKVKEESASVKENRNEFQKRYQGVPRNVLRHVKLADLKDVTAALPVELANIPILSYDPLPPEDEIVSYQRPHRPTVAEQNRHPLALFFQSLLPNYNPHNLANETEFQPVEGAEGENNSNVDNFLNGITSLRDAMRDLLLNIQPTQPNIENEYPDVNSDEEFD